MDPKSFHVEDISCALCENRRGINSTCCCPEDAKDLVLITEEKLRRRIGLEAHQKLCCTHASKLKYGLLFGGSSVFQCCAPFHVNTARSPGLRSVPHNWKEYFPSPTHSDDRYRPRQRICWDCYAVALEVINAEQLDSSDDESTTGNKSSPSCLGYVSPRRWASNLQLFPTSPHGSQYGSAWSLARSVGSPKSATLRGIPYHDKEFDGIQNLRDRINARSATLPTPKVGNEEYEAIQSPLSPSDVFTTTWSLDPNYNVTGVFEVNNQKPFSQLHSAEESLIGVPFSSMRSAEDIENVSTDRRISEQESLSRKHHEGNAQESADSNMWDSESLTEKGDINHHFLTDSPPPSYGSHGDYKTVPFKQGKVSEESEELRAESSPALGNSEGTSVDKDDVDSVDVFKMERERGVTRNLATAMTKEKEIVEEIVDNQLTHSPILQRTWGESNVDYSSDQTSGSDWVSVQPSEMEGVFLPRFSSGPHAMYSPIDESIEDDNKIVANRNIADIDHVIGHREIPNENMDGAIPDELIAEDESFRFDPIVAAHSEQGCEIDNDISENASTLKRIEEPSHFDDIQSSLPNITAIHDEVHQHALSDATNQTSGEKLNDALKQHHNIIALNALHYDTDDSSSSNGDFGLRPIAEEPCDAVNNHKLKSSSSQLSNDTIDDQTIPKSDDLVGREFTDTKQDDLGVTTPCEMIDDTLDRTNNNLLGDVCVNGELPPISYMHERRQVKLDQASPQRHTSQTDGENIVASQTTTSTDHQNELAGEPSSVAKTDLYTHLHGSKDSAANSSSSDQECEPAGSKGLMSISNPSPPADSVVGESENTESQNTNRDEYEDVQQLRRRRKNERSHSVDVDCATVDRQTLPKRPSIRSDGIIANRKKGRKNNNRKLGVTFALPIIEAETPQQMKQGERKKNKPLERASTEIVESHPDARTLETAALEDETPVRAKTLRESRRISNKERLSSLQKPKETVTDDENKPDEDEDVSAILSDIISNVFTMRDLADWARSFSEDSMPMILFAGVSITAALSLSLIAFLALR